MKKIFIWAMILLTFSLVNAVEPIFHCEFEESLIPSIAMGDRTPTVNTPPVFQPGLRGSALLIGQDAEKNLHGVSYPHSGNLDWTEGSISLWIKPINWKGTDTGFFAPFFDARAGENLFLIYKYYVGETLYFMRGEHGFWLFSQFKLGEWQPGEWHHIVCNWNSVQLSMYIDGQLVTERRIYFPLKNLEPKKDFVLGEWPKRTMSFQDNGRLSLLDEFKIFNRQLTLAEVRELYEADNPQLPPQNLLHVGPGKVSLQGTGFCRTANGELAIDQSHYSLGYDTQALHVGLKSKANTAVLILRHPDHQISEHPLKRVSEDSFESSISLAELKLAPGQSGWQLNIRAGDTDLGSFARLMLNPDCPPLQVKSIYDLEQNQLCLQVERAPGLRGRFETATTRNYGFRLYQQALDEPWELTEESIPDWLLGRLEILQDEKLLFRHNFRLRKNLPLSVKFLYTLIENRELFVAFEGRNHGRIRVKYIDLEGKIRHQSEQPVPQKDVNFFNLTFPILVSSGEYNIHVEHLSDAGTITELWVQGCRVPPVDDPLIKPYHCPDRDKLPPGGWTPVVATSKGVDVWGRHYGMADGLLFDSLSSQGKELLASPDQLLLDGQPLPPITPPSLELLSSSEMAATYRKRLDYGKFSVESHIKLNFDGYVQISLKLIPGEAPLHIQSLAWELPMHHDRAKLLRDNQTISRLSGLIGDSFEASLLKIPMLWLGDYQVGINFTAENLVNWHFTEMRHVSFQRENGASRLRFLLISAPLVIEKPREYNFGLTVTPTKPLNRKILRQRASKDWQMWFVPWKYFNHLDHELIRMNPPWNGMDYYQRTLTGFKELFHYSAFNFSSPFLPAWTWYEEEWRQIKAERTYGIWTGVGGASNNESAYCEGCINSDSYRNYRLNNWYNFLSNPKNPMLTEGARNIYFDAPWEESCYNEKHGCIPWRDSIGKMRPHIVIDRFREMAIDVYRMIKNLGPDSKISYHAEWQRMMPYQTFADVLAGGEGQEHEVAAKGSYYDIFTPANFCATFSPYLWNTKTALIPQIKRGLRLGSPQKARDFDLKKPIWRTAVLHYLGMCAVHDTDIWGCDELVRIWWDAQDQIGWDENTMFFPYWDEESPAVKVHSPVSDRIVASAYVNSGRMLLAVLNDTDEPTTIKITLDLAKLQVSPGLPGKDAFDLETSYTLASEWQGEFKARGFRLIVFKVPTEK